MEKNIERMKMVKAMEFIARQVNNEEIFNAWLTDGVPDGDIEYGDLDVKDIETVYRRLSEAGYHMLSDGIQDIDFWEHGARYFFIQGPNNEKIEFCEVL